MNKIEASIQHVSVFRIRDVYLIGVLYDFQADNQEGTVDIIVQGNSISVWIEEADGPMKGRTATATAAVHIVSASGPIEFFKVKKSEDKTIIVPVFSLNKESEFKVAGQLSNLPSEIKRTLSVLPENISELPEDVIRELGIRKDDIRVCSKT